MIFLFQGLGVQGVLNEFRMPDRDLGCIGL